MEALQNEKEEGQSPGVAPFLWLYPRWPNTDMVCPEAETPMPVG